MKPLNLNITNYRAFERVSVPLASIDAASITGTNGAGKSTIVEAILWAVYGDGRSSGVDGVVRLGADEASVQLDYAHNGSVYRVIRKRSRGKKSDLQYMVGAGDDWVALTGSSIKETQEKIVRDLAMDSTLFRHSSCVMQGDSAGICEATPAERKAVLYQILEDRLAKFGQLHDAAKARVKALDEQIAVGRNRRAELEARISSKSVEQDALEQCLERSQKLSAELVALETEAAGLRDNIARSQADQDRITALDRQAAALRNEIEQLYARIAAQERVRREAEGLLAAGETIKADCARADELESQIAKMEAAREAYRSLGEEYRSRKSALDLEGNRFQADCNVIEAQLDQVNASLDRATAQARLLHEVPCSSTPMAEECKLLADARKAADGIDKSNEVAANLRERIRAINDQLKANAAEYAELEGIKQKAAETGYVQEDHARAQEDYRQCKGAREKLAELSAAEARREAAETAIAEARAAATTKEGQVKDLMQERQEVAALLVGLEDIRHKLSQVEMLVTGTRASFTDAGREAAVHEERLRGIAEAETELIEANTDYLAAERSRVVIATLQDAFSRDGIPALIIDAAVPAIEEIANDVLSALSDGRMSLKFITQKAKTTGGIAETLDIIIADSAGERLYEDFSGGEKLRVDLAVRIALGRMLSQRSGARIELLVLDEVCAPLDQAGEDALIDVINRLRDGFGQILLITHRESLRDRLPQQIIVSRNGAGSVVDVLA